MIYGRVLRPEDRDQDHRQQCQHGQRLPVQSLRPRLQTNGRAKRFIWTTQRTWAYATIFEYPERNDLAKCKV